MNPLVSCLCCTYGRFSLLRQALACFLAQDYEPKELIILNDHPKPIRCDIPGVRVINAPKRFDGMGSKQNALLAEAGGIVGARWDDDDFYLPWHLSHWVPILLESGKGMLKIRMAYSSRGLGKAYGVRACKRNSLEAHQIYLMESVRRYGYDPKAWRGESKVLYKRFRVDDDIHADEGPPWCSLVFGWACGTKHLSLGGAHRPWWDHVGKLNQDVSDEALTPADISVQLRHWIKFVTETPPLDLDHGEQLAIARNALEERRWEVTEPQPGG